MKKAIIVALAVTGILASASFAIAQDSKAPPPSNMEMMRGMNEHMAEMEKRMGGMRQMMQGCMANDKTCPKEKMMMDMQGMHTQMGKMMASMKSMTRGEQPKVQEKVPETDKPEDHEQHH